ncbi:MAG: sodium:solute symporter family protein [Firmicutes bacterium]|nr:sodium:solute symporter family protein [Bacillota bacterium]
MILNPLHWAGVATTIALVVIVGLYSGKRVKSAGDFLVAGRSMGPGMIAGSMLGTLIGGSSTIGTAEMAFKYGFAAWWWALGMGAGCVILALVVSPGLHRHKLSTIGDFLERAYGPRTKLIASLILLPAMCLTIVPNVLSALAILSSVSRLPAAALGAITLGATAAYVVSGGVWGAGTVGVLKVALVSLTIVGSAAAAVAGAGGVAHVVGSLPPHPWFSLFGRGLWIDLGAGIGTALGVAGTQVYVQILASARSHEVSRCGTLIAAVMSPILGVFSVFAGLAVRVSNPSANAAQVLPSLILGRFPPLLAGIALGALFIAVLGSASGIALGIGSLVSNDLLGQEAYDRIKARFGSEFRLLVARTTVFTTLAAGVFAGCMAKPAFILDWAFLSMGLRVATVTPAFIGGIVFGKRVGRHSGIAGMLGGMAAMVLSLILRPGEDVVFPALATSIACMVLASVIPAGAGTSSSTGRRMV